MLTKCVASSLLSCEAVVGFSYPSGYLVLWLCHGFLYIAAHCIAGSLSGVPCSKRFHMSWEEHAEYVCTFKNDIDGAQVFLCSAFTAVIGFPSGHTWSCLWGLQLFFVSLTLVCPLHLAIPADVQCYHIGGLFFLSYCGKEHMPQCLVEVRGQLCRVVLSFHLYVASGAQT